MTRNPALLAKMAATLQFLSSGGSFWASARAGTRRYRAYGYNFPPAGVRVEQMDETLQMVQRRCEHATVHGKHFFV